ncbi:hypothetical protein V7128_28475, partial [Neobacillus vireti]|uniref:hypothetical protein n=1 Tax=Neobacillus vireti TaxID=220686 RepID=UPI002FFEDBEA
TSFSCLLVLMNASCGQDDLFFLPACPHEYSMRTRASLLIAFLSSCAHHAARGIQYFPVLSS